MRLDLLVSKSHRPCLFTLLPSLSWPPHPAPSACPIQRLYSPLLLSSSLPFGLSLSASFHLILPFFLPLTSLLLSLAPSPSPHCTPNVIFLLPIILVCLETPSLSAAVLYLNLHMPLKSTFGETLESPSPYMGLAPQQSSSRCLRPNSLQYTATSLSMTCQRHPPLLDLLLLSRTQKPLTGSLRPSGEAKAQ